jgi:cellulase (glycosyl hydrolase family 5)
MNTVRDLSGSWQLSMTLSACVFLVVSAGVLRLPPRLTPLTHLEFSCDGLGAAWNAADWPTSLSILDALDGQVATCGADSLRAKRYAAHFNWGAALEQAGQYAEAVVQYRAAYDSFGGGRAALDALVRFNALPVAPIPACEPDAQAALPPYLPTVTKAVGFVTVSGNRLAVSARPYSTRGVNYYPRRTPWERFLTESDMREVAHELDLIASAGFNTLRTFVRFASLFTCAPEYAIPKADAFARLDAFIHLAAARGLRLILTLNDQPDLYFRPLYTDWQRTDAQTRFIVNRYRDEPVILAWDLRNEGDIDYGAQTYVPARFTREQVLGWLAHSAQVVRAADRRHLLTAGWWGDPVETSAIVDVVSFHHWWGAAELQMRMAWLQWRVKRPVLLEEVGYASVGLGGETWQRRSLQDVLGVAEGSGIAGWLVWAAFDFSPLTVQPWNAEQHFGLWRYDLTAKPALNGLPLKRN